RKFKMADATGHADAGHHSPVHKALTKIELPSILFFLGILMAVACLESLGILFNAAEGMNKAIPNTDIVVLLLGMGSAVIDNVPLVAASIGMFSEPTDHPLWHFIAYAAGTGGSMLIIGSAAGVVAMGMEKIDFFWYLKKIAGLALIGFLAGALAMLVAWNQGQVCIRSSRSISCVSTWRSKWMMPTFLSPRCRQTPRTVGKPIE
ncbi:MAG: hypothetical protein EBZ24_07150, partial [Synechococcaceae bacterium WB9_4xB_025]|nr:hypothetical protein [Synechococcaceae bacterium WB9_4xB_025]